MNNTKLPCSLDDTEELRKLILENPTLPLITFASEDACSADYSYSFATVTRQRIEELAIYNDELWCDYDDYAERLSDDLADEEEYKGLSSEQYDEMIEDKMKEVEFVKAIVIWIG